VKILKDSQPGIVGPFAGSLNPRRWTTIVPSKRADYISGSCIGIHREVIEKVGYFYEPYFLYYEEVDLCLRAKKQGFLLRWLPIKEISHEESVSLGKGSFLHQYYLSRNHLLFVERQAPFRVKLYEFLRLPKTIYEHYVRKEWGALAGIIDYFLRRFGPYRGNL
ncbi:MAG: glycosyltransferase family 2 protein, partial [Patescibacteria group bacterium]